MKNSMKNSIAKDGRKSKGKFGGFIKSYFLEILGIVFIIILLIALVTGKKSKTYNNIKTIKTPSSMKVSRKAIVQRNNSRSIKVNYNKNTYELNKGDFDLFVNQYQSQGIFRIKPTDILEGNTIIRFSYNVCSIKISGNKKVIDNIVFRFISKSNNLLEKVEENGNSITLYIRRKENFSFYINLKNKEKISKNFIKNDPLFYIEYQESTAE